MLTIGLFKHRYYDVIDPIEFLLHGEHKKKPLRISCQTKIAKRRKFNFPGLEWLAEVFGGTNFVVQKVKI